MRFSFIPAFFFFFVISILLVPCLRIKMWLLYLFSCLNDIQSFLSSFVFCCCLVAELSPTLLQPHGLQPFSRGSPQPREGTHISCLAGGFFTTEPPRSLPSSLHSCKTAWAFRGKRSGLGYLMGEELSPHSIRTQKGPSMVEALANLTGFFRLWEKVDQLYSGN